MGCAASAHAPPSQQVVQPTAAAATHQRQQQQQFASATSTVAQRRPPGPNPQQSSNTLKSAPLVKSLIALHRDKCSLEANDEGTWLNVSCMSKVSGEAVSFFRASGSSTQALADLTADRVSKQRFDAGMANTLRLLICPSKLSKGLEGFSEGDEQHSLVLDLRADSSDPNAVTVQRTFFKLGEGDAAQVTVHKQMVQCGTAVRTLEALYGTLPNPRETGRTDIEGGDCVICLSKPRDVTILHCRHVCLCTTCAQITSSTWGFECPVCRGRVAAMVGLSDAGSAEA